MTLSWALRRDVALFGSADAVQERYRVRYLPAQALYRAEARTLDHAHVVVDDDDPAAGAQRGDHGAVTTAHRRIAVTAP